MSVLDRAISLSVSVQSDQAVWAQEQVGHGPGQWAKNLSQVFRRGLTVLWRYGDVAEDVRAALEADRQALGLNPYAYAQHVFTAYAEQLPKGKRKR